MLVLVFAEALRLAAVCLFMVAIRGYFCDWVNVRIRGLRAWWYWGVTSSTKGRACCEWIK